MVDSQSRVLITMDGYYRSGKLIDHKRNADIAVTVAEQSGQKVDKVFVWPRPRDKSASTTPMASGRDYDLREVMKEFAGHKVAPVSMPAEAPLFLMYTSGTTGRPKGCQHSMGGYLAYVAGTSKLSGIASPFKGVKRNGKRDANVTRQSTLQVPSEMRSRTSFMSSVQLSLESQSMGDHKVLQQKNLMNKMRGLAKRVELTLERC